MDKRRYNIWLLIPLICSVCFGTLGDITLDNAGNKIFWPNNSQTFSIAASGSMSESVDYLWPPADAVSGGQALLSDSTGVLSWGTPTTAAAHALMSGTHSDTTNSTPPARGSIIYGNSTPVWDEFLIGTGFLKGDGTDITGWDTITLTTDTTGNYVASITDGLAIDGGDGGSEGAAITIAFDPTELLGNRTWGDGSTDTIIWTWDRATGTDPSFTFGDDVISTNNFTVDTDIYADNNVEAGNNIITSAGGEATPSHTFTNDLDTGMWSSGANTVNISVAGTEVLEIDSTEATFTVPISTSGDIITTGGNVDVSNSGKLLLGTDDDLEVYHNGGTGNITNNTGNLAISTVAGNIVLDASTGNIDFSGDNLINANDITANDDLVAGDKVFTGDGLAGFPSYTFSSNNQTGMWLSDANILNFSAAGVERLELDSTEATFAVPILTSGGLTVGDNIVSDTASTDDLGTLTVPWANLFVDDINKSGRLHPNDEGISSYLLVAYWPFDSNDVAYDYSGNGHDGTIFNTLATVDGKFGAALDFNTIDVNNPDRILVADDSALEPANITVSVWVKTAQDDQDIIRKWEGAPNRCWTLNIDSSGRAVFSITNNGTNIFSAFGIDSITNGEWHMLTGTYDGETVRVYIDAVFIDDNTDPTGDLCTVTADVKMAGRFIRTNSFKGLMDEMMVFGRALSAEEIKSLYESNRQLKDERLFPVYDDLPPSPIIGAKLGSTAPTLDDFISDIQQYRFDNTNDFVIGSTEVTHGWKEGTIISPHVHWATNGLEGAARDVQWQLKLTVGDSTEAFSAQVTTVVDVTIPANTPDRTHFMTDFDTTIDGTNLKINSYICWRFERIANGGGNDEPAADPFGLAVGFHVLKDSAGSFTKDTK